MSELLPIVVAFWVFVSATGLMFATLIGLGIHQRRREHPGRNQESAGRRRRKNQLRGYLIDSGVRFVEGAPIGQARPAFYLPDYSLAIVYDARDYRLLLDVDGIEGMLLEEEVPLSEVERRLPFGRTRVNPSAEESIDAFDVLGLQRDATEEEIERRYRQLVLDKHPDQGGSRDEFEEVKNAYEKLSSASGESSGKGRASGSR